MDTKVNNLDQLLAERLRQERKARGWSMADLAERSGVSRAMIGKIENAEASPTATLLSRIATAFGMSLSTLLARAESAGGALRRIDEQTCWTDPDTGYLRRAVSAPHASGAEIVEVTLPAGAKVSFPASSYMMATHQILVLDGILAFHDGPERHEIGPGDLYTPGPPSDRAYENAADTPCRYLVILTRP